MSKYLRSLSLAVICLSLPAAYASDTSSKTVYKLEDFQQFAPTSALDMLRNVSGFTISQGENVRGLGQANGNVLINGKRVSTKSSSLRDILRQISPENVVQITIQDASEFNIPGLSGEIANVETNVTGFSGKWRWTPVFRSHREPWWSNGEISASGETGPFDYTVNFKSLPRRITARGPEFVRNANGDLLQKRNEHINFDRERPSISTRIGYESPAGSIGNLNLKYETLDWHITEYSDRQGFGLDDRFPSEFHIFDESGQNWEVDINADYEFDLGDGRLKLIGLYNILDFPHYNQFSIALPNNQFENGARYHKERLHKETILRSEYSWVTGSDKNWQLSLETAFNSLEQDSVEFSQIAGTRDFALNEGSINYDLVEEKRAEVNFTHGRPLSSKLDLQTSLGAEFSEISQAGTGEAVREFIRPKGFASLSYAYSPDLNFTAKLERLVGQLNFGDFLATRDLIDGSDNGTNTDLVPDQRWRLALETTKQFGPWGSTTLELAGEEIEDFILQIPLGAGNEAPGNLDTPTRRLSAIWSGTFNFKPLNIDGLKLDYTLESFYSNLEDPLTGEGRRIDDEHKSYIELLLQYDIPNSDWALSTYYEIARRAYGNRLDLRFRRYNQDDPFVGFTITHKDVFGMKASLGFRNMANQDRNLYREFYVDRRDSPLDYTEFRNRKYDTYVQFSLSSTF